MNNCTQSYIVYCTVAASNTWQRRQTLVLHCSVASSAEAQNAGASVKRDATPERSALSGGREQSGRPAVRQHELCSALPIGEERRGAFETLSPISSRDSVSCIQPSVAATVAAGGVLQAKQSNAAQRAVCVASGAVIGSDRIGRSGGAHETSDQMICAPEGAEEWSRVVQKRGERSRGEAERATCASRA